MISSEPAPGAKNFPSQTSWTHVASSKQPSKTEVEILYFNITLPSRLACLHSAIRKSFGGVLPPTCDSHKVAGRRELVINEIFQFFECLDLAFCDAFDELQLGSRVLIARETNAVGSRANAVDSMLSKGLSLLIETERMLYVNIRMLIAVSSVCTRFNVCTNFNAVL